MRLLDLFVRFLVQLKEKCSAKPGNPAFWDELRKIGRELSLISESEAEKNGGESDYSESKAKKVRTMFISTLGNGLLICFQFFA